MNNRVFLFLVLLVVGIPLFVLQAPILIQSLPRPILKLLCFTPFYLICYFAFRAFGEHNFGSLLLDLLFLPIGLYSGLTVISLIEDL